MPRDVINNFNGGANNFLAPHLLNAKVGQVVHNANVESGSLVPIKGRSGISAQDHPNVKYQNESGSRSIVRFGNNYFWSDNDTGELDSSLGYFGIDPPREQVTVTLGDIGDRITGIHRFRIRFRDTSNNVSSFNLPGNSGATDVEIDATKRIVANIYPSFRAENFIQTVEFDNFISPEATPIGRLLLPVKIRGYKSGSFVTHQNSNWRARKSNEFIIRDENPEFAALLYLQQDENNAYIPRLGRNVPVVDKPDETLFPGGTGNRWEKLNDVIETTGVDTLILSEFPVPIETGATGIDSIDIFATPQDSSDFYFVDTVRISNGIYNYALRDEELVSRPLIDQDQDFFPPLLKFDGGFWQRVGGRYLTNINERYWLASESMLYHSKQSDPHLWNPSHSVSFDSKITALAKFGESILVFIGDGNPYIVSGTVDDGTITKTQIPSTQGCPNWRTISYAGNAPIWQSNQGIAIAQSQPIGVIPTISVISKNRYRFDEIGRWAVAHNDDYHLFFDGHEVVFDLADGRFYTTSTNGSFGYSDNILGKLIIYDAGITYQYGGGEVRELEWKSRALLGDVTDLKRFTRCRILGDPSSTLLISLWSDGRRQLRDKEVATDENGYKELLLPNPPAYKTEISLKSRATIHVVRLDYDEIDTR